MAYNQSVNNQNVRVGNWFEELRLQDVTGIRYFPDPKDKKAGAITGARCFVHTEQTLPKDYSSTTKDEYTDPKSRPEASWSLAGTGPRQRLKERELKNKSDNNFDTQRAKEFKDSMVVDYRSNATLMNDKFTKVGFKSSLNDKDPDQRYHTNHASYLFEKPITVYSDILEKGGNISFPCSFICSSHPFRRNNLFTVDPKTSLKQRAESYEKPTPLPTAVEYQTLQNFKLRSIDHVRDILRTDDGRAIRSIVTALWSSPCDDTGLDDKRSQHEVGVVFSGIFGIQLTEKELKAISRSFDCGGCVSLVELSQFLRPVPNLRRLELIASAFAYLDTEKMKDSISKADIEALYRDENISSFIEDLGAIHMSATALATPASPSRPRTNRASTASLTRFSKNSFIDYYVDVSAEIVDDMKFEQILLKTWNFK